jgi:cytochrome b561/polyisoprenoid-binding protein YceI
MPAANTARTYGTVTKVFHWLTALLILTLIPLGIIANDLPYDTSEQLARKAFFFSMHKTLGVTMFFVALARILWAVTQPKPGPLHPERRLETWAADTVHWLLYGSLVLVPLSGWVHHASTSGFAPIWWPFGQNLPLVPKSENLAGIAAGLHIVFERVLLVALILHVAGALKHHFVDRDQTLRRMWFGRVSVPDLKPHVARALPAVSALAAWCVAVGLGGLLGLYASHAAQPPSSRDLAEVASEWEVTEGDITIAVKQMGSEVTGRFAEWTADISFDPSVERGKAGDVEVTIAIGSLTIGSVTKQAMGSDFFDEANHPRAVFAADLMSSPDGYVAEGTLTLKGNEVPVNMPYELNIEGDTAKVEATVTLDRRNYEIGVNQTDDSSLGFDVRVSVDLTAVKSR